MRYITGEYNRSNRTSEQYLQVNSCGFNQHSAVYARTLRRSGRVDHHILYVIAGSCTARYDHHEERLQTGDFLYYPPGMAQDYRFAPEDGCRNFWLHFTGTEADAIMHELGFSGGIYHFERSERAVHLFEALVREYHKLTAEA